MALEHLANGFDRTVIMDMINSNDDVFSSIISWVTILIPIYLIISILLQGGLLFNINRGEVGFKSQIKNGTKYLLPFFGIALFSIVLIILFLVVVGLPFRAIVGDPLTTFSSEKPFVLSLIALAIGFSIWLVVVWSFSISTRYNYINGASFWKSINSGFTSVRNHLFELLSIGYLLLGAHLLLAFIYYLIMGDRGAPSWLIVIFGILVQQLFSFARVFIRGFGYIAVDQVEDKFIG
tara:strand:+ start:531 stop:1238 length:708 start_codon:yes stop_codon:yes gene_type:complete